MAQVIGGRYTREGEIGAGGMGMVYRGTDRQTGQPVAIKQLKADLNQPELLERFRREGEALRELNHPNIVRMLDAVEQDGQQYLMMEYLPGGDLNLLLKAGRLPVKQVLEIAIDLADALTRAHRLNIVHRDLKPANVLLADDGTPRLTDFGVAHIAQKERVTGTGMAVGTLDYLSPEALGGEGVDARADIWAFGVMLFEMLAGQRPFYRPTIGEVIGAIMMASVPDLEALRPDLPVGLVDLIYRMLEKDRSARIPSIRVVGAELEAILQGRESPERFHTPVSVELPAHNLPPQITAFIGRETELDEIASLLTHPHTRLVTILAPGGMGKTRLSLETAQQQVARFEHGAFFVALAPVSSSDVIVPTIADAVSFQFSPGGEPKQQLLDYLRDKKLLLVTDNFEHVLDGAGIVGEILAYAPEVKILATSRERLNLSGETLFALSGMDFPEWETPEDALNYAAVKLFMQSARRVRPDFELTGKDLTYLTRICRLVAGMPLGIVLAAAWVEALSLREIAGEIAQSLDFLETELRDVPERQRSIRGVFEYSWNRLSDDEREVFKKLSVFRGGFTREAAQAVAGASLKTLMALMNKSLIHRDAETGRYAVHELLRQYGEKEVEAADALHDSHLHYFAEFMAQRTTDVKGKRQPPALDEIDMDFANVRAAWEYAVSTGDYRTLEQMCECLSLFCDVRNALLEGEDLFKKACARFDSPSEDGPRQIWGHLLSRYANLLRANPSTDKSRETIEQALETSLNIARAYHDLPAEAFCLAEKGYGLAYYFTPDNHKKALVCFEEAKRLYDALNETYYLPFIMATMMWCRGWEGSGYQEAVDIQRRTGDKYGLRVTLSSRMWYHLALAKPADAERCILEAMAIEREINHGRIIPAGLEFQSCGVFYQGDFARAEVLMREMVAKAAPVNNLGFIGSSLTRRAVIRMVRDTDYEGGKKLAEEALGLYEQKESLDFLVGESSYCLAIAAYAEGDYDAAHHFYRQVSRVMPTWHIPYLCLTIFLLVQSGKLERAIELLSMLYHQPEIMNSWKDEWVLMKQVRQKLEQSMSAATYAAAWEHGKTLDWLPVVIALLAETDI